MVPTLSTVDLKTNEIVGPPPGVTAGPSEVALSPDGTTLAVANHDPDRPGQGLSLFDVASGQLRRNLKRFASDSMRAVGFSPDSRYVFAITDSNRAVVWDAATGEAVFTFAEEPVPVTRLAMSPSGRVIALGMEDGRVKVWTSADGRAWFIVDLQSNHHDDITWIDFDSRSQRIVTTSRDGVGVVWDAATGDVVAGPQEFRGKGGITTFFRPGSSTTLLNVDSSGHTVQWELPLGGLSNTVPGVNLGATVSASPDTRVPVSNAAGVTVYDPSDGSPREVHFVGSGLISGIAATEDGRRFLVVYNDTHLELRDMDSGDLITALDQRAKVQSIFSSQASIVVTREVVLALDRGGTRLAFPTERDQVVIVDDRGTIIRKIDLPPNVSFLQALDLNEDGSELVLSTKTGEAIWYAADGSATATLAPSGSGFDAQFVSDGRVAVVGKDGAQIIDPRSRQTTERVPFGVDASRVAVDSTGRLLATVDATGAIQLWDAALVVRIGAPLHVQSTHSSVPIRFSTDGHYLVVSGPKETTWIDVWAADWPGLACNLVTDKLSSEERARYLGSRAASDSCP